MLNWLSWNFRAFRIFGIEVRIHWSVLAVWVCGVLMLLQAAPRSHTGLFFGYGLALMTGLWLSILLHEFGHCWAARSRGVPADSVVLWWLGGLAHVGGSGSPWNEVWIAFAGPLVNLVIAAALLGVAAVHHFAFNWGLLDFFRGWAPIDAGWATALAADLARLNVILALFNLCLPAYPLDGGRILRGLFSVRMGFERATYVCTTVAIVVAALLAAWGVAQAELTMVGIGAFVLFQALQERRMLREGALEGYSQTYMGHDFSMGYTSLERDDRRRRRRAKPGFFARLRQRLAEARARREREEEERVRLRVDQLLEKVSREGIAGLKPDERRDLEEASRRFQEFESRRRE